MIASSLTRTQTPQQCSHFIIAFQQGDGQRRLPECVFSIQIRPMASQQLHDLDVPVLGGNVRPVVRLCVVT